MFEIRFNIESTFIIVMSLQVMQVFSVQSSEFRKEKPVSAFAFS